MKACAEVAKTANDPRKARQACAGSSAKAALADALGKSLEEVDQASVGVFLRQASKPAQADKMTACIAEAADAAAKKACRAVAKANLAE